MDSPEPTASGGAGASASVRAVPTGVPSAPDSDPDPDAAVDPVFDLSGDARVREVCVVSDLFDVEITGLRSGIDKRPVERPVRVLRHGIWGDVQGDRENHGGTFKAVYAFAQETRLAWAERLGRDVGPGGFGENLVTAGIDVDESVIGTRWRVGSTELMVTAPRNPCRTFTAWMGEDQWTRRFNAGGRSGTYLRVLEPGEIGAGDMIAVDEVPGHGVTVGEAFRGLTAAQGAAVLDWSADTGTMLYEKLVLNALGALRRAGTEREFPQHLRSTGRGLGRIVR